MSKPTQALIAAMSIIGAIVIGLAILTVKHVQEVNTQRKFSCQATYEAFDLISQNAQAAIRNLPSIINFSDPEVQARFNQNLRTTIVVNQRLAIIADRAESAAQRLHKSDFCNKY